MSDRAHDLQSSVLLRRLWHDYLKRHLKQLMLAVVCMVLVAASTAMHAWLMEPVLDRIFLEKSRYFLFLIPFIVIIIALVKGIASYGQVVIMARVGQKVVSALQNRLYRHLLNLDVAYFAANSEGSLISRFTYDINLLRIAASSVITGLAKDTLTVFFLIVLMFYQDWRLALVAFIVFPMAVIPIQRMGRRMRGVSGEGQGFMGELTARLEESFRGIRQVKAYNREASEAASIAARIHDVYRNQMRAAKVRGAVSPIMEAFGGVAIALVILYGGSRVLEGQTTPGTFFSFIAALLMAYQPFKSIAKLNTSLQEGLAAADRVYRLIDMKPGIASKPDAPDLNVTEGAIRFDNVGFDYHPESRALTDLSLMVQPGQTVALVGPSGAGKTTLLNLLPRFFEASQGSICIDDQNIRDVSLSSLRQSLALVSQEVVLFDDTVLTNIAFGREDASKEEIIRAAKDASAHDFIMELPNGYETMVGSSGVRLSGGQRQRLSIARAMLKKAPILLLDEATSALDTESERMIQMALTRLMAERTVLVIAHRLSTIIDADRIIVMDRGKIVESGTHETLLALDGHYARLHQMQTRSMPLAV